MGIDFRIYFEICNMFWIPPYILVREENCEG